jgi:hypothetical protein
MSLTRPLSRKGIAHANADSPTHASDVARRAKMRQTSWIPEESKESLASEFKLKAPGLGLGKGVYWNFNGESLVEVDGKGLEAHCNAINWERRWYTAQMKRGDKISRVRRKRKSAACEEVVVNLHPAQMHYLNNLLESWSKQGIPPDKRREHFDKICLSLRDAVLEQHRDSAPGFEAVACYLHLDSNKIHFGIIASAVNGKNELSGKRPPGVGAWSVGAWRLATLGIEQGENIWLKENIAKFRARHGSKSLPYDIALHRALDLKFDKVVAQMGPTSSRSYRESCEYYRKWKTNERKSSLERTPSTSKVVWKVLFLLRPLLPPAVRTALDASRSLTVALKVIQTAVAEVSAPSAQDGGHLGQPPQIPTNLCK